MDILSNESFQTVLGVIKTLLHFLSVRKKNKDEIYIAIESIQEAANKTIFYYSSIKGMKEEPNIELSEYWLSAAKSVRKIDENLYERLLYKANFWADPTIWTNELSQRHKIYLDEIIEDSKNILKKSN